ncbi:MAG: hypothetical protein NTX25_00310 [Proteobacteria bacterium]|nr:hypothetical protein [Pseudomonadota bacterium]
MLDNYFKDSIDSRHRAISLLLANDLQLLEFLFSSDRPILNSAPKKLLDDAEGFSWGRQLLVRLALDIWSDAGGARLADVVWALDDVRFEGFLLALESLRYTKLPK